MSKQPRTEPTVAKSAEASADPSANKGSVTLLAAVRELLSQSRQQLQQAVNSSNSL